MKITHGGKLTSFSFDNVMDAVFTLFEVSTLEMYLDVLYACADSTREYALPSKNYNATMTVLYFILFIILASFFFINVFVSVVIENFEQVKEELDRSAFMTKEQRAWLDAVKKAARTTVSLEDDVPEDKVQLAFYNFVQHKYFDQFIMYCILLNAFIMTLQFYGQPDWATTAHMIVNYVFAGIFFIEMVLKLIGLSAGYFKNSWNCFDFAIVLFRILNIVLELAKIDIGMDLTILRVLRAFRLVKNFKTLQRIMFTLLNAIMSMWNIVLLLVMLLFVYGVMGMNLYGDLPQKGEFLNAHANFDTFGRSFITLFRMTTGESWNAIVRLGPRLM